MKEKPYVLYQRPNINNKTEFLKYIGWAIYNIAHYYPYNPIIITKEEYTEILKKTARTSKIRTSKIDNIVNIAYMLTIPCYKTIDCKDCPLHIPATNDCLRSKILRSISYLVTEKFNDTSLYVITEIYNRNKTNPDFEPIREYIKIHFPTTTTNTYKNKDPRIHNASHLELEYYLFKNRICKAIRCSACIFGQELDADKDPTCIALEMYSIYKNCNKNQPIKITPEYQNQLFTHALHSIIYRTKIIEPTGTDEEKAQVQNEKEILQEIYNSLSMKERKYSYLRVFTLDESLEILTYDKCKIEQCEECIFNNDKAEYPHKRYNSNKHCVQEEVREMAKHIIETCTTT